MPPPGTASCHRPSFSLHVGSTFLMPHPLPLLVLPTYRASASSAYPTHTTPTTLSLISQKATFSSTQVTSPSLAPTTNSTTPSPGSTPTRTPTNSSSPTPITS